MVSIVVLFVLCASASLAQDGRSEPATDTQNKNAVEHQRYEQQIDELTKDVAALQRQVSETKQNAAAQEKRWWQEWLKGDQPPVWSNWLLFIAAIAAGVTAYHAFTHQRDAVRLTQRADIVVDQLGFDPPPHGQAGADGITYYSLPIHASIVAKFRNFGPTRANDVKWDLVPIVDGVAVKDASEPYERPIVVLAGGDDVSPRTGPLTAYYDQPIVSQISGGAIKLRVKATISYRDVFDKTHTTTQYATYRNGGFIFEEHMQAD